MIMSIKFEEQFKYRDESNLNAATGSTAPNLEDRCAAMVSGEAQGTVYPRRSRDDNHRERAAAAPLARATGCSVL
jgi:hypothetical protein